MAEDELLGILACPKCHGKLEQTRDSEGHEGLGCRACALLYVIEDGLPNMLIDEAKPWSAAQ